MPTELTSRSSGTRRQGEAVNPDGSLKEASEMIWVHDPDDEEAMPGTAADERLQSGTADLQSTGTFPLGEAVNADGTLKDASEITWIYDPDDEHTIIATTTHAHGNSSAPEHVASGRRSNKRKKVDINMFLDIEAAVDVSSNESDEGTEGDFIDDMNEDETHAQLATVPNMTLLDAMEAESNFVESLMKKYVEKDSDRQVDMSMPSYSDWGTWEVPVSVGTEAIAVFRILRRCQEGYCINHNAPC